MVRGERASRRCAGTMVTIGAVNRGVFAGARELTNEVGVIQSGREPTRLFATRRRPIPHQMNPLTNTRTTTLPSVIAMVRQSIVPDDSTRISRSDAVPVIVDEFTLESTDAVDELTAYPDIEGATVVDEDSPEVAVELEGTGTVFWSSSMKEQTQATVALVQFGTSITEFGTIATCLIELPIAVVFGSAKRVERMEAAPALGKAPSIELETGGKIASAT